MEDSTAKKGLIRKYLPIISLILLTVLLMVFFKHNKRDFGRMFDEGKKNLAMFYSRNLKPLFVQTEISEEDVFNFALYNTIPLDKSKNKVLIVNKESNNNLIYEVKPAAFNPHTNNYERFVEYLHLDEKQKEQADSILNIYKKKVYLSVLTDNKNTVAVNNNLAEVQRALLADILTFAQKVNAPKSNRLLNLPANLYEDTDVEKFILSVKELPQNEFIFITPDTAFTTFWKKENLDLNQQFDKFEKDKSIYHKTDFNFKFHFDLEEKDNQFKRSDKKENKFLHLLRPDSNIFKVVVPPPPIPPIPETRKVQEKIISKLDKAAGSLRKISIIHKNNYSGEKKLHITSPNEENGVLQFEFNINDISPIISETIEILSQEKIQDWEKFGNKMDSLYKKFSKSYQDSITKRSFNNFR